MEGLLYSPVNFPALFVGDQVLNALSLWNRTAVGR